jgi:putative cardiolipin synthase
MHRLARALAVLLVAALAACAQLKPRPELPVESAVPPAEVTRLDQIFAPVEAKHPGESAFRLVKEGTEAFVTKVQSARLAERTLDVQTYIWHADMTGIFIAQQLLEAADRGVKVRVLVDDMDARAKNAGFAALDAHANIEVRMFNPFASRSGTLRYIGEGMTSFGRINHRMHNKTWIADNRIAIAGGRNIGDEYYGASEEVNFVDLEFAMIGPIVRDASASFDKYWNSPAAYPMEVLDPAAVSEKALETLRPKLTELPRGEAASRYTAALRADDAVVRLVEGDWPMEWAAHYKFISDDPLKATMKEQDLSRTHVASALVPMLQSAQGNIDIISPYFVPGEEATAGLVKAAKEGRNVRVLTNSLAANDVAAVHGGYSRYRKTLVEGGVHVWELKPFGDTKSSFRGSSGASLHTKALSVDGEKLFVGSYNLDPRSTWLNCEQGVLVENEVLTKQLEEIFDKQASDERSWQVTLKDDKLSWSDGKETFDDDPHASMGRRFQAWFARTFHLDAQL